MGFDSNLNKLKCDPKMTWELGATAGAYHVENEMYLISALIAIT